MKINFCSHTLLLSAKSCCIVPSNPFGNIESDLGGCEVKIPISMLQLQLLC